MPRLKIDLFGKPQITLDGSLVTLPTARSLPLLAYLAISGESQSREILANFLWTDSNQKQALAALRTTIWRMKSTSLNDWISINRNEIALTQQKNIDIDVVNFRSMLEKCSSHGHQSHQVCLHCTPILTEAIHLYQGEFLAGSNIAKAPAFDDWRMQQSENLRSLFLNALERLVKCHRTFGDFNLAIDYANIWLHHDHLNETVNLQLLQLYSITGQRTAAISLYKRFKELLSHELGIEPSEEMVSLYKQIVSGQMIPAHKQTVKTPVMLFSDIEKADLYWARVGDKKNHLLSTYINIIKETARRFGGFILQRGNNSITLLFESGQPLHCAVTIHLRLKKIDWGDTGPPNIRMVLYSTLLESENPDNFAELTRTASSLLSISWGGQIIFTDQTLRLLDIPLGANIKDLGFHYLNEADGAVHVYELLHPHLPSVEHPPLQSNAQQLVNFPSLDPPFIGRQQELSDLVQLLTSENHRIISLVGSGGIGKTRLAVQVSSQVMEYFPDGIFFVSFASTEDPEFIPILLAEVLKFSFFGPMDHMEQLRKYLHRMKALFVIDNFEHLRLEGARILSFLLAQTQNLKIMVTSRERLNMIAETIYEVHGLPVPSSPSVDHAQNYSSIQLFIQNAQRTFPRFSYQSTLGEIIHVCQLVEGLPLGILLASSWVRVFSCGEISEQIIRNVDFLTTTAPDVEQRHSSLIAVFNSSWKLMSEEERRIMARLSIFQAAFTIQAANDICDATPLLLSVFVDKSLLTQRPDGRFEMLATFHQYVYGKLEQDDSELDAIKIRFCEYYADFCAQKQPELNTSNQINALNVMAAEMENLRNAWSWMVESDRWDLIEKVKDPLLAYHVILGNFVQGGEFFRLALLKLNKLADPELDTTRAYMAQLSSWMTYRNGFVAEGIQGLTECLQVFRTHHSYWGLAMTLQFLAEAHRAKGALTQAREYIEEALMHLQQNSLDSTNYGRAFTAHCRSILGTILVQSGEYQLARRNLQTSLAIHNELGTHYGTIHPLLGLGMLAYHQENFIQSGQIYLQALETASSCHDQRDQVAIHIRLAAVYEMMANTEESYRHVLAAFKLCQETGDHLLTAITLNNLAYQQLKYLHQPAESIWTYHKCLEIFNSLGDLRGITYTSYDMSKAYLAIGLTNEAVDCCHKAMRTALTLDSIPLMLHTLHGFALIAHYFKRDERALQLLNMIIHHPATDTDTRKRAIVSKAELEVTLPCELCQSAQAWGRIVHLQDVVDQILADGDAQQR